MNLLIAGIDPGTHSAYALLDIDGKLVDLDSYAGGSIDRIVSSISGRGKVFLIGCDVNNIPGGVHKVASSIGAKVIRPQYNLGAYEKIKIVDNFLKQQNKFIKIQNKHEKDALAAALYAHRRIKNLLNRIDNALNQLGLQEKRTEILYNVFVEDMPISRAIQL